MKNIAVLTEKNILALEKSLKKLARTKYRKTGIPFVTLKFAQTLDNHRYGLINHCYYPIDTGKLEGMNNKIKVIKRIAYGFHDDDYFILKIKQGCSPPVDTG